MSRRIILAEELRNRLNQLTTVRQEVNGVLLYRQVGERCPIEGMYVTAIGTEGHVKASDEKVKIVNEFFNRNPDHRYVKFHTHTVETVKKYGDYYAKHFSSGDIEGIKEQLKADKEYIAMLVTPEKMLLSAIDNPNLEVVSNLREYTENNRKITEEFRKIIRDLGIEQERLIGSKRR